jgi:hypothetical protein
MQLLATTEMPKQHRLYLKYRHRQDKVKVM